MSGFIFNTIAALGRVAQSNVSIYGSLITKQSVVFAQSRYRHTKHWNPKFKKLRKEKVIRTKLPNFNEDESSMTPEQIRSRMKEQGLLPARPWIERPMLISCTGSIFEAYVPPEGDGKFSAVTTTGAKQKVEFMTKKGKSFMAVKKIEKFEEDFSLTDFALEVQDIYLKAHEALAKKDKEDLRLYVTERAYPEVLHNIDDKTVRWSLVNSLELPRPVHARVTSVITKDNMFGQITVRFHTQQILAVYDRFGRLMHGSEIVKKDVLEYVVFEKHLSNEYGSWRVHAKIIPSWMPEREFAERTLSIAPEEKPKQPTTPEAQPNAVAATTNKETPANVTA